jgi:NADPH-dependent 2,4-dienoyl-CoA reductase/sulfur reductase-like enzyme
MERRDFYKRMVMLGVGANAGFAAGGVSEAREPTGDYYHEPAKKLPVRKFDVVVGGGGTAGVVAAIAAARNGAKTT